MGSVATTAAIWRTTDVEPRPETSFVDLLRGEPRRFLLTGHEHPDGDCLGAEVALFVLLEALGHTVTIVNPDPLARNLEFLAELVPIQAFGSEALPEFDVVCLLDCAWFGRTGSMGKLLEARVAGGAVAAVIDHHVGSDDGDGSTWFVDSTAAATGELVYRLFREFEIPLTEAAATGVFLSLVSDTGWFRYSNTNEAVLTISAELVQAGVDPSTLYDRINRQNHPSSLEILRDGLAATEVVLDGRLAFLTLDKGMMDRIGRTSFDTDLLLEPVRSLGGIEVVALIKERFDGAAKLSLRASGDVDVQAIAAQFGGGGHRKAAGATVTEGPAHVRRTVEQLVGEALDRLESGS